MDRLLPRRSADRTHVHSFRMAALVVDVVEWNQVSEYDLVLKKTHFLNKGFAE